MVDAEERKLEHLAKRLFSAPHKLREESKVGKSKQKPPKSPARKRLFDDMAPFHFQIEAASHHSQQKDRCHSNTATTRLL
jgi:hypothetical protein